MAASLSTTSSIRTFHLKFPTEPIHFVHMCVHKVGKANNGILAESMIKIEGQSHKISIDFSKVRPNSVFQIWAFQKQDNTLKPTAWLGGNALILKQRRGNSLSIPALT